MKKKKAVIKAALITATFAAAAGTAAHLEWVGYNYFDRADGSNMLCKLDPYCRDLTTQEVTLARKYFGNSINYKAVKVFDRGFMWLGSRDFSGMSPNGNLYFAHNDNYRPNFATDPELTPLFMHEMTHVAQFQRGMNIPHQAFKTWLRHGFNYQAAYHYEKEGPLSFLKMNLEQQAKMMEDYFWLRSNFELQTTTTVNLNGSSKPMRIPTFSKDWQKQQCTELKAYERKLSSAFYIVPDELCQPPHPSNRLKLKDDSLFNPS